MNSIDIIKQELINQKNLLDEKGFIVATQGKYPSPSEITNALTNIELNYDFTKATATEEDVMAGKTFFAGTSDLRTGTFDSSILEDLKNKLNCFVTGTGACEIYIPEDAEFQNIREYAFSIYNKSTTLFCKENLTIPSNIKKIGARAFYKSNITGKLTIPSSCTSIDTSVFQYTKITEVFIGGGITSSSSYALSECTSLKKAYFGETSTTVVANYLFANDTALREVYLPATVTTIGSASFYACKNLKLVKFMGETPVSLNTGVFIDAKTATILVPYQRFHAYFTATNYQKYGNPIRGWGNFSTGTTLPIADADGLYTITWFASFDDMSNATNPVTSAPNEETLYAIFTEVASEATETTE